MNKFTKYQEGRSICLSEDYGAWFRSGSDLEICQNMNKGWSNNGICEIEKLTYIEEFFVVNKIEFFKDEFN